MILEGNITIPYKWTTGATVGRFLAELKEVPFDDLAAATTENFKRFFRLDKNC